MKLNEAERLILYNQYRILQALIPDEAKDFENAATAIQSGYTQEYARAVSLSNELDEESCREVKDILDMYRLLTAGYRDLTDKGGIDERRIKFSGFDGNDETESAYLAYVSYLLDDLGLWSELRRDGGYNNHNENLPVYREMLRILEGCVDKIHLKKSEIESILEHAPIAWG